jgi:hypothetical protein
MTSRGINADSLVDESTPIEVHPGGSPFVLSDHANPWQRCGQAELSRLKPGRIVVLGGSNAVSERVAQELHLSLPR